MKVQQFSALADNFSTSLMRIDAAEKTDFGADFDQYINYKGMIFFGF